MRRRIYTEEDVRAESTLKAAKWTFASVVVILLLLIVVGKGGLIIDLIGLLVALVEGALGG